MTKMAYIIAEAGSTHDHSLEKAIALVRAAKAADANAVKFQWLSSAARLCERRNAAEYIDAYQIIAFPPEWHEVLAAESIAAGVDYLCTTYLPEDVEVVARWVPMFKVASFEAGATDLLEAHRPFIKDRKKPLIVSTGMGDDVLLAELRAFEYAARADLRLLHCVSSYPAPMEALNLGVIRERLLDGFSDHTGRAITGSWAVAAGARMLEVHFRLDSTTPANKDYPHALTVARLTEYVKLAREAAVAIGSVFKAPQPCEAEMARYKAQP